MSTNAITRQLVALIISGDDFTADDVTKDGQLTIDQSHAPNGRQSTIGTLFMEHSRAGHIEATGRIVKSRAPHRKGGGNRVWRGTPAGISWASSR